MIKIAKGVGAKAIMGLGTRDLLIDLSYGRVGSYLTTDSPRAGIEDHYYVPLNSFKTKVIRDVPEGSLVIIPAFDSRCPGNIALLFSGEHGEAPLLNDHLEKNINRILTEVSKLKRVTEIKSAASSTQQKITDRGAFGGGLNEYLKQIENIRKSVEGRTIDRKKRSRVGGFRSEE